MTLATDLLKAADTLAHGDTEGHWRRAVSTAYYAAFHCLVEHAVPLIFATGEAQRRARTWFEHSDMSTVAAAFPNAPGTAPPESASDEEKIAYYMRLDTWRSQVKKYDLSVPPSEETQRLAGVFVSLQRRRHAADYFPLPGEPAVVERTQALQKVRDARTFCDLVAECCEDDPPDPDFVALVSEMLRASVKTPRRS